MNLNVRIYERRRLAGLCTRCGEPSGEYSMCPKHMAENNSISLVRREQTKQRVLDHYGWSCACCGESELLFLQVDHINVDRHQDNGSRLYSRLVREGFPNGYQTLCANCNHGKARNGGTCPHQTREGRG